jgi:dipeptidyl aminopeptidase/acylaminoacyl peptidase
VGRIETGILRRRSALLLLFACTPAVAQLYKEEKGPGLDPTPLEIPAVVAKASRPITSMDLLTVRDLYGIALSPDGSRIAYVVGQAVYETNRYRSALFVVGTKPGSAPVNLGNVGPPFWKLGGQWFPEPPQWSPDGRLVALRMKRGDGWQVWRWKPEGGEPVQITHCPRDVQSFRWSADGSRIVFEVYRSHDEKVVRGIAEEGALFDQDFQSPWDIHMPLVEQKLGMQERPPETWLHDVSTGEERPATPEEVQRESIWVRGWADLNTAEAAWSPDHKRLAYNKYVDDPARCAYMCYPLFVKDKDGGEERLLSPGVFYAGNPQWSADGTKIYFERRDSFDGFGTILSVVSAQGGPVRTLLGLNDHVGRGLPARNDCSWDARKQHAACVVENNVTPARLAFVDVERGTSRVVADVNPEFANLRLSPGTRIDWKNDGNMFAYLVKPLGYVEGKRYPLIVTTYLAGSGFLRGGVGDEYPIHVFAANGFAVLVFDCGAQKNAKAGDFETAMLIWEDPLKGLTTAIQKTVDMGIADPKRVGFSGLSHGSEIGAFAISHSSLFRAASMSGSGSWDVQIVDMLTPFLRLFFPKWGLIDADGKPVRERFDRLSATANVEKIHTPLLLNAPDSEYLNSLPLYTAMRSRRKPVEMWVYPDEYHEKIQPKHRYSVYERNVDWFRFWLKGEEDPAPAKRDQYEGWRKLRQLDERDRQKRVAGRTPA